MGNITDRVQLEVGSSGNMFPPTVLDLFAKASASDSEGYSIRRTSRSKRALRPTA
jgi:hypothetical protein